MSVKKSMCIMLLLISVIPTLLIGILIYSYLGETLISTRTNALAYLAKSTSEQIQTIMDLHLSELESQRRNVVYSVCLENLQKVNKNHEAINTSNIQQVLSEISTKYSSHASYRLYDTDFCLIANSTGSLSTPSKVPSSSLISAAEAGGKYTICGVYENGEYNIDFVVPVHNESSTKLLGYITCTIGAAYIQDLLKTSHIGETGETILIDDQNLILYANDSALVHTSYDLNNLNSIKKQGNSHYTSQIKIAIKTWNQTETLFILYSFPGYNWHLIVSQDMSEITASSNFIIIVLLAFTLFIFIFIYFISNQFSTHFTRPIFELRDTMKKVSNGDFNVQCQIKSKNEFGELAENFNQMIKIVQSSYNELSSMHEQLLDNEEELQGNYKHIEYLAYHDLLTNLPNKLYFLEQLDLLFHLRENSEQVHGIYFLDMDNFKTINDTLGHDLGDEILISSGKKISSFLSSKDILARVGGDEFLIFKYDVGGNENALSFANELLMAFSKPFIIQKETIYVGLSIGISLYPFHGATHKVLIKNADIAMYKSKELGRNRASLFDKRMEEELNRNAEILDVLRTVIANHEIYLMYQPQIDIKTQQMIGFEALMRINSQKLGQLSPREFIPIAEESGLIVELGLWVLKEACHFNKQLMNAGYKPCAVSVNISSIQINQDQFIDTIKNVLEETGLPSKYLELEITESTLISSLVDSAKLLKDFQDLGVQISLDDFGTGYSSLKYLTSLPINTLKIDKSFIDNICNNAKDTYIAKSIITLAHQLKIKVIAEGVEDYAQLDLLKEGDCDVIQGYLFSRPLLPDALNEYLYKTI